MSYTNIEKQLHQIQTTPEHEIFDKITQPIYSSERSILHAAAIERNRTVLTELLDLLPKDDKAEALEEPDGEAKSSIVYASQNPEMLKTILSQYKDSTKPLHILCHISGKSAEQNLGMAIAFMEHDMINANLMVGDKIFNPANGLRKNDDFRELLPDSTVRSYTETKEYMTKRKNAVKEMVGSSELSDLSVTIYDLIDRNSSIIAPDNMSYQQMKARLNEQQENLAKKKPVFSSKIHIENPRRTQGPREI